MDRPICRRRACAIKDFIKKYSLSQSRAVNANLKAMVALREKRSEPNCRGSGRIVHKRANLGGGPAIVDTPGAVSRLAGGEKRLCRAVRRVLRRQAQGCRSYVDRSRTSRREAG